MKFVLLQPQHDDTALAHQYLSFVVAAIVQQIDVAAPLVTAFLLGVEKLFEEVLMASHVFVCPPVLFLVIIGGDGRWILRVNLNVYWVTLIAIQYKI